MILTLFGKLRDSLIRRWVVCSLISDKKSARYGAYFSYPIFILIVTSGILLRNQYILSISAFIAFLGIKLPMHPFDYLYNFTIAKLHRLNRIPGRGSELQVNSIIALVFSLVVLILISLGISINYEVLAILYTVSSMFFISIFLIKN